MASPGKTMLATTIELIRSGLKTDPTLAPADRARLLALIRNGANPPEAVSNVEDAPRLISRAETARRLSRSLRLVDKLAAEGILKKRKLPGRVRAAGFLESDVAAFISDRS